MWDRGNSGQGGVIWDICICCPNYLFKIALINILQCLIDRNPYAKFQCDSHMFDIEK